MGLSLFPVEGQSQLYPAQTGVYITTTSPVMITSIAKGWAPYMGPNAPAPTAEELNDPHLRGGYETRVEPMLPPPPPSPPVMAQQVSSGMLVAQGVYIVKNGGHLSTVAERTNTSLSDLVRLNPRICPRDPIPAGTAVLLPIPGQY